MSLEQQSFNQLKTDSTTQCQEDNNVIWHISLMKKTKNSILRLRCYYFLITMTHLVEWRMFLKTHKLFYLFSSTIFIIQSPEKYNARGNKQSNKERPKWEFSPMTFFFSSWITGNENNSQNKTNKAKIKLSTEGPSSRSSNFVSS